MSAVGLRLLVVGLVLSIAVGLGFAGGVWWMQPKVTKVEKDLATMAESRDACQSTITEVARQAEERATRADAAVERAKGSRGAALAEETRIRAVTPEFGACAASVELHRTILKKERGG